MAVRHSQYTEIVKAFGKAVRIFRLKSGSSQEALADKAKLDRSYMSQIERGIKNATLNSIWTISSALDVKPSMLLEATEHLMNGEQNSRHEPEYPRSTDFVIASPQDIKNSLAPAEPLSESTLATQKGPLILVVDDDEDICAAVGSVLKEAGFGVCHASNGMEAIRFLSTHANVKAIVSDVRMSHGNGFELLEMVRNHFKTIPLFFITGYDDVSEEDAIRRGARGLFNKPFDLASFVTSVKSSMNLSIDPVH